jgi:hypothetical protein
MNKLVRIQNGESLPFKFDRDGDSIDGWTCTIFLKRFPQTTELLTGSGRVVPPEPDLRAWVGFLTNSETDGLTPGKLYWLIAALVNLSTNEVEEVPVRVSVTKSWTP